MSREQLALALSSLNSVAVKPYLFKFIHDLYMVFTKINCPVVVSTNHGGTLIKSNSDDVCCPSKCSFGLTQTVVDRLSQSQKIVSRAISRAIDDMCKVCNNYQGIKE